MTQLFGQLTRMIPGFSEAKLTKQVQKNKTEASTIISTIAFNNTETIFLQAKTLKAFIADQFQYWVFDNSKDEETAKQLERNAKVFGYQYFRLPLNPESQPSRSHGYAINWVHKNFIRSSQFDYWVLLDHDIFPFKSFSVQEKLKKNSFYGLQQTRDSRWYLWPGYSFFRKDLFSQIMDFLPGDGLDTGGGNWKKHYFRLKVAPQLALQAYVSVETVCSKPPSLWKKALVIQEKEKKRLVQSDSLCEIIDGSWLHVFNASDWKKTGDKSSIIRQLKQRLLA